MPNPRRGLGKTTFGLPSGVARPLTMRYCLPMTQRITDQHLAAKVATINRMLGNPEDAPYLTPGLVVLGGAYGGTTVHLMLNEHGGVRSLMGGYYTKREVSYFLDGMIQSLRLTQE